VKLCSLCAHFVIEAKVVVGSVVEDSLHGWLSHRLDVDLWLLFLSEDILLGALLGKLVKLGLVFLQQPNIATDDVQLAIKSRNLGDHCD
jgi:hypothetical protein